MSDSKTTEGVDRRGFLRWAGTGAGAVGAMAVSAVAGAEAQAKEAPQSQGYTETLHVKHYYATLARF